MHLSSVSSVPAAALGRDTEVKARVPALKGACSLEGETGKYSSSDGTGCKRPLGAKHHSSVIIAVNILILFWLNSEGEKFPLVSFQKGSLVPYNKSSKKKLLWLMVKSFNYFGK